MKKLIVMLFSSFLLFGIFAPTSQAAEQNFCDRFKGVKKIWWNGAELKPGQIGRLTVLKDTSLYKLDGDKKTFIKTLKKGEFYRIYAFKPGMLGLGGGYYIDRDTRVKYETPSKTKLDAVACINGKKAPNTEKVYTTKEIVDLNDEKIVLIETDKALGSGIVIGNGLILTNNHVVEDASKATVTFNNGQKYEVEGIVESDPKKDIAIIKTTKTYKTLGVSIRPSSKGLSKGEKVVAIGNPKGLQNTVSEGIISSFRTIDGVYYIQTNADIDHGSSGGGLFNMNGQLIGITTSGIDSGSANLNFAVTSDEFVPMVNKYINKSHGSINASFQNPSFQNPSFPNPSYSILGDIALGMSKQQVKNLSSGILVRETTNELIFDGAKILDYSARVIYEFENNKLVAVTIFHDVVNNMGDLDLLESFFVVMYQKISQIYGNPDILDTDWMNDDEGYKLSAFWQSTDHATLLTVVVTIDYDSYGGIRIEISE